MTTTTYDRLLIEPSEEMVRDWHGPLLVRGQRCVLVWGPRALPAKSDQIAVCAIEDGAIQEGEILWVHLSETRFDLRRAECRDRVAHVYGADEERAWSGVGYPFNIRLLREQADNGPPCGSCGQTTRQACNKIWLGQWYTSTPLQYGVHLPALAELDVDDTTRLPDGFKLVDALGIATVHEYRTTVAEQEGAE